MRDGFQELIAIITFQLFAKLDVLHETTSRELPDFQQEIRLEEGLLRVQGSLNIVLKLLFL